MERWQNGILEVLRLPAVRRRTGVHLDLRSGVESLEQIGKCGECYHWDGCALDRTFFRKKKSS